MVSCPRHEWRIQEWGKALPEVSDIVLVVVCLVVSLFSPSVGTSGGVTFAVMATMLPPSVVVPLHALVEGLSSAIRWTLLREFVNYRFLVAFTLGGVVGLLAGWPLIGYFSDAGLKTLLGVFFLFSSWAPLGWMRLPPLLGGVSTSCLSVLVGATGPLVAALIARQESDHRVVVGTQGACTTFQHWGKALLFAAWGFSFANYTGLIVALTLATIIGTWLGKRILLKVPQRVLRLALKIVVTVLGLQLLIDGLGVRLGDISMGSGVGVVAFLLAITMSTVAGYRLGVNDSDETILRSAGRCLHDMVGAVCRPHYAFAVVVLLGAAIATSPHRAKLGDMLTRAPSKSDPGSHAPQTSPRMAVAIPASAANQRPRGGLTREDGEYTTVATNAVTLAEGKTSSPPHTNLQPSAIPSQDTTPVEQRPVEDVFQVVSLQASRALSAALTRYWLGDTSSSMGRLADGDGPYSLSSTDRDALDALRERLQGLFQRYMQGQTAFLRGDKDRAFDIWRAFLLDEKTLQLPTWSTFALEVKARAVDEYTMRGDVAQTQGHLQAARQLWAHARKIDPGGRAARSLARLDPPVAESGEASPTDRMALDEMVALFQEGAAAIAKSAPRSD